MGAGGEGEREGVVTAAYLLPILDHQCSSSSFKGKRKKRKLRRLLLSSGSASSSSSSSRVEAEAEASSWAEILLLSLSSGCQIAAAPLEGDGGFCQKRQLGASLAVAIPGCGEKGLAEGVAIGSCHHQIVDSLLTAVIPDCGEKRASAEGDGGGSCYRQFGASLTVAIPGYGERSALSVEGVGVGSRCQVSTSLAAGILGYGNKNASLEEGVGGSCCQVGGTSPADTIPDHGEKSVLLEEGVGSSSCCQAGASLTAAIIPGLDELSATRCVALATRSSYSALALVHRRLRELVRSDYLYELRQNLGVAEQWVYLFVSGDLRWKAFDPSRRQWLALPPCPATNDYMFLMSDKESLSAGTHLLWVGRENISMHAIARYELATNTWFRGPPMNTPRCLFASASCGELAFVAGGNNGTGTVLHSAERYNSRLRQWDRLPNMVTPRQKASGCYLGAKFYVIGGRDACHKRLYSAEAFNPTSQTWEQIPNMLPEPAGHELVESSPPLIAVANNRLYCIDSSVNVLKLYHKENNSWTTLGPIPVRADSNNGWGLAFKALGNELYVIGGYRQDQNRGGMAMFSWNPVRLGDTLEWTMVTFASAGSNSYLENCAIMAC